MLFCALKTIFSLEFQSLRGLTHARNTDLNSDENSGARYSINTALPPLYQRIPTAVGAKIQTQCAIQFFKSYLSRVYPIKCEKCCIERGVEESARKEILNDFT